MGVKNICDAFIPYLKPKGGRIVNISSGAAPSFLSKVSPDRVKQLTNPDITWNEIEALINEFLASGESINEIGYGEYDKDWTPYGFSKAILNAYTINLAREYPDLVINACSPGMIKTDLFISFATSKGVSVDESISGWGAKDPSESVVAPIFLLFSDNTGSGYYYGSDAKRSPMHKYRSPGSEAYDGSEGR